MVKSFHKRVVKSLHKDDLASLYVIRLVETFMLVPEEERLSAKKIFELWQKGVRNNFSDIYSLEPPFTKARAQGLQQSQASSKETFSSSEERTSSPPYLEKDSKMQPSLKPENFYESYYQSTTSQHFDHKPVAKAPAAAKKYQIPEWSIEAARNWLMEKKLNPLNSRPTPFPELFRELGSRDHFFLIDHFPTMRAQWKDVGSTVEVLSHVIRSSTGSGKIEFQLTGSERTLEWNQRDDIKNILGKELAGQAPVRSEYLLENFESLMRKYIQRIRKTGIRAALSRNKRPLSVYILIDKNYGCFHSLYGREKFKAVVKKTSQVLEELAQPLNMIGAELIYWGAETESMELFENFCAEINSSCYSR